MYLYIEFFEQLEVDDVLLSESPFAETNSCNTPTDVTSGATPTALILIPEKK